MTTAEAAKVLGRDAKYLSNWARMHNLRKDGYGYVWSEADVELYRARTRKPISANVSSLACGGRKDEAEEIKAESDPEIQIRGLDEVEHIAFTCIARVCKLTTDRYKRREALERIGRRLLRRAGVVDNPAETAAVETKSATPLTIKQGRVVIDFALRVEEG